MNSKKLTVGLVLDDTLDVSDGVQAAVLDIGSELSRRGHDVHYIVASTTRTDLDNVHVLTKQVALKFNGNSVRTPLPVSARKIKSLFADVSFDVLHVQMPYSPLFAARVVSRASQGVKIFGTFHILPYNRNTTISTKLLGMRLSRNLKKFTSFFAVSEPARKFMAKSFKVDGEVMPNPVNYGFYNSFKKGKHKKTQIVFVGRFEERKGVKQLVRAYAQTSSAFQAQSELIMCGKGPLLDEVKGMARELGVNIKFSGFVTNEQKAQYLADADIAVFPSVSGESFGIVLTEAMSAGAGVTLGGNNPGYESVLTDWPDALFDPDDIEQFAVKLEMMSVSDRAKKIGQQQHKKASEYDINRIVDRLLIYYTR